MIDRLFDTGEKRLTRTLLLLARYGQTDQPLNLLAKVSQETRASMVENYAIAGEFLHEPIQETRLLSDTTEE